MGQIRRFAAYLGILAILFAQAAVAVYACPALAAPSASAGERHAPCADMDPGAPNLCERHCHGQDQQPGSAPVAVPLFVAAFMVAPSGDPAAALSPRALAPPAPAASPPLAFRHRFRL